MRDREILKKELNLKYPLWGYSPKGLTDPVLSLELSKAGAAGLMDFEGLEDKEIKGIIKRFHKELPAESIWGVRVSDEEQLNNLYDINYSIPLMIIPFLIDEKTEKKVRKISTFIVSEVLSPEEAEEKSSFSDLFLVKGQEAGGKVGEKSTFILLQEFYKTSYPFVIQGGFGLFNIAGAITAGSLSVVLDSQLYLFPECPLSPEMKTYLKSLQESDTYLSGETCNYKFRLSGKIASKGIKEIKNIEKNYLSPGGEEKWEKALKDYLKSKKFFNGTNDAIIPLGQDIAFASYLYSRFKNLKNYLEGINNTVKKQIESNFWPFTADNELAGTFNLKFPVFQGPMANINDNAGFAFKVAEDGAFPVMALGHMFKPDAEKTIISVKKLLKPDFSYGCGIIGLTVNQKIYEEHLELIRQYKPDGVWIAGGSVELAMRVKDIPVFLHTPALQIFRQALDSDIYCMILEGAECGGHTGVLSSFVLWESILEYLDIVRNDLRKKVRVLFAGGFGTSLSSAILAVITAMHREILIPGIQVGTAYMFTKEIVNTGALSKVFQEILLKSRDTKVIGSTVNLRARVIPTKCADDTIQKELERIRKGLSMSERKGLYEKDNIGGLRIAVKGEKFNPASSFDKAQFLSVTKEEQVETGCFMSGEISGLCDKVFSISELHNCLVNKWKDVISSKSIELDMDAGNMKETENNNLDKVECRTGAENRGREQLLSGWGVFFLML